MTTKTAAKGKADAILENWRRLRKVEPQALQFWREPDWTRLEPQVVLCRTAEEKRVWDYYRYVISSEPQSQCVTWGRETRWMVIDRVSGCMLGVMAIGDALDALPIRDQYIQWSEEQRKAHIHRVLHLARCLPTQPFGGKGMAMWAMSREVVRTVERRYSHAYAALTARTLHGRSSQYNRIDGLEFVGGDVKGMGFYLAELRKGALRFLRGEMTLERTKSTTRRLADVVQEWLERWYGPRLGRATISVHEVATSTNTRVCRYSPAVVSPQCATKSTSTKPGFFSPQSANGRMGMAFFKVPGLVVPRPCRLMCSCSPRNKRFVVDTLICGS